MFKNQGGGLSLAKARHAMSDRNKELAAKAELGKLGISIDHNFGETRAERLKYRSELRRGMNALRAEAEKTDPSKPIPEAIIDAMSYLAAATDCVSAFLDADEAISLSNSGTSTAAGSQWRDQAGNGVEVYAAGERIAKHTSGADTAFTGGAGFGAFIKALAAGSKDHRIRAELGESSIGTGGATVPTHLMRELIDAMRAQQVCVASGARTVILETEKTTIARLETDPAATWRLENAAVTESDPTFAALTFQARSLAVLVKVSFELLQDSVNIDQALMSAFAQAMALQLDGVALTGTGTAPQPRGIWNTTNVNALTPDAAIDYGDLLDAVLKLKQANSADPTAVILNPADWRILAGLTDSTGQPLTPPPAIASIPLRTTTGISAKNLIVGDFTQLMIGVRSQMRVEVLREAFASNLQVGFLAHLRADVQVAQPKAFCKITTT